MIENPKVGLTFLTSSPLSLLTMLVFPALSMPLQEFVTERPDPKGAKFLRGEIFLVDALDTKDFAFPILYDVKWGLFYFLPLRTIQEPASPSPSA
mmetsp:Transcript_44731/g.173543  ORF Transcript_44731/g.173543 Transcript_44731/m.173543 type:complete len:95 (-) Transcript_44731:164-448(-)